MIDPSIQPGVPQPAAAAGLRAPASVQGSPSVDGATAIRGARFQALLEELDLRAKAMAKSAQEPLSAETLPAAVENARSSLEDALALSQNLLEAWQQSVAQSQAPGSQRP